MDLHPNNDINRLYESRKKGGKGIASIENAWTLQYKDLKATLKRA